MKVVLCVSCLLLSLKVAALPSDPAPSGGIASWYGEAHRGKPMANGVSFDPDKLTAASWFFPLGTRVRVTVHTPNTRSIVVAITDRGPAKRLVQQGRIIDLSRAAFRELASLDLGLIPVTVERLGKESPAEAGVSVRN